MNLSGYAPAMHATKGARRIPRFGRLLAGVIGAGLLLHVILALATHGQAFDMGSMKIVRQNLSAHGFEIYRFVNVGNIRWPYPPLFFPWIALSGAVAGSHVHVFEVIVRLPAIAADGALAWLVQEYLRGRGAHESSRLAAAALIVFGPVFVIVAGFQSQIDAVAILPAVLAVFAWERLDGLRRPLVAGALIGLGASVKTVPIFMVLALAPSARSWRDLALLASAAVAVPLAVLLPFMIATPGAPQGVLRGYHGYPGQGGPTLAVQPGLTFTYLKEVMAHYNGLTLRIVKHAALLGGALYLAVGAFLARYRPPPALAASLLWLATYALSPAFFFQYLVWGLPFFVMAGYLRAAAALQAGVLLPMIFFYQEPWRGDLTSYIYIPVMLVVWAGTLVALGALARGIAARRQAGDLRWPALVRLYPPGSSAR